MSHRYGFGEQKVLLKHPRRLGMRELLPLFGLLAVGIAVVESIVVDGIDRSLWFSLTLFKDFFTLKKGFTHVLGVHS